MLWPWLSNSLVPIWRIPRKILFFAKEIVLELTHQIGFQTWFLVSWLLLPYYVANTSHCHVLRLVSPLLTICRRLTTARCCHSPSHAVGLHRSRPSQCFACFAVFAFWISRPLHFARTVLNFIFWSYPTHKLFVAFEFGSNSILYYRFIFSA